MKIRKCKSHHTYIYTGVSLLYGNASSHVIYDYRWRLLRVGSGVSDQQRQTASILSATSATSAQHQCSSVGGRRKVAAVRDVISSVCWVTASQQTNTRTITPKFSVLASRLASKDVSEMTCFVINAIYNKLNQKPNSCCDSETVFLSHCFCDCIIAIPIWETSRW